jgi:predicted dehydrogenase
MQAFLEKDEVQWVAVCDIDKDHLKLVQDMVNEHYGNEDCATYHDFRELFARKDLDAVSIAVPDHWHAFLSINAARAGFDIYGEKPLTHSLVEGRAHCDAMKRYGKPEVGNARSPIFTKPASSSATAG